MKSASIFALAAALLLSQAPSVQAVPQSWLVSFTASGFFDTTVTPGLAPVDPVTGSFTLSFDDALDYADETAGISLVALDIALGSALAFNYTAATGRLEVGGLSFGAAVIALASNDFWLYINGFDTAAPSFDQLGYATVAAANDPFFTLNQTGTVTRTLPPTGAVPLPAAAGLLAGGLGLLAALSRRR